MKIIARFLTVILFVLFFVFALSQNASASSVIYQDNFNSNSDGSFPSGWSLGIHNNCPEQWQTSGGAVGLNIQNTACISNIYPDDAHWTNSLGDNYSLELDANFVSGTDHNIAFWYDKNLDVASELHFQSPGDFSIAGPIDHYTTNVSQGYPNGHTYHIKVVVSNLTMQVYIDGTLVRDALLYQQLPSTGRIALRATSGTDSNSNTNFDNVVVTKLDNDLVVPVFKQTDLLWATDVYDGANNWSPANPTISRWGCALTSAAMILKYNGYNFLPDGTPLDPGSLNTWLKNNHGFDDGINNGYVIPAAISRLSRKAKLASNITAFNELEANIIPEYNPAVLINDLANSQADVIGVNGDSHFVVVKGINGSTFDINDPLFNRMSLNDGYNNTFSSITQYKQANSDISYIFISTSPNVTVELKDSNNIIIGESFIQNPIIDPLTNVPSGEASRIISFPKPPDDSYSFIVSSPTEQYYKANIYLYDKNGDIKVINDQGTVGQSSQDTSTINFNSENASSTSILRAVSFQNAIDDVNESKTLNLLKGAGGLLADLRNAQKAFQSGDAATEQTKLNQFLDHINQQRGKNIDENAYQILLYDADYLKNNL